MARIRTQLRHRKEETVSVSGYQLGSILINTVKHAMTKVGRPIHLTPKEFDLLLLMMKNVDRVLTHKQILNVVWEPAHTHNMQYLRVMIRQIRQKIENNPSDSEILLTEAGFGYRLNGDGKN